MQSQHLDRNYNLIQRLAEAETSKRLIGDVKFYNKTKIKSPKFQHQVCGLSVQDSSSNL